jgi:hypothetical protein
MRTIVAPLFLALLAPVATAQCFDTNLGTPLGTAATLVGDVVLPMQGLGFAFPLGGTSYTDVHIADKGYFFLSNNNVPAAPTFTDFSATASELATLGPRIAPLWSDLQAIGANGAQIWLNTSTPGRAVITWQGLTCYLNTCGPFDMQCQLLASGEVFLFWGNGATNNSDPTVPAWQAGVCGIAPDLGTLGALSDLSTNGLTANNVVVEEWLGAMTFDMAGRGLHLIPTNPGWIFQAPAGCANAQTYGTGCVRSADSIYEQWLSGFDLANTTVSWLRSGNGYVVTTSIPGTFVAPTAAAVNVATGLLDGSQTFAVSPAMPGPGGAAASITVTTKGQILLTATAPVIDYTPTPAELLAFADTQFALWHDFDQTDTGSGLILWEQVGTTVYVTWNGVHSFSASTPNTFQFQLDLATGNVTLVIQTMGGFASPDAGVLGFSVGGPSPDPGATDFSALTGVVTIGDAGTAGLRLAANGQPRIGNATFQLVTSDVPNLVPIGIQFFGTTQVNPGLDLTFLGMPGCFAYTDATLGSVTFPVALPAGTGSVTLPIPNNVALVGTVLTAQSVAFTTATAFGLATSNGLLIVVGN